jgi:hypothetical protein
MKKIEIPTEVEELLTEFKEELPHVLPPVKIISHQIDFIPRSSFPNKAPHRMTHAENEELNRQVHELLERGLIKRA